MNELTFRHFLHISVCLKSIKTFIGWGLHSARKWTIVLDKLLTIMVGHFFSDHSPILHCGVSFFLSINNKVHNDAFLNNTVRQWLGSWETMAITWISSKVVFLSLWSGRWFIFFFRSTHLLYHLTQEMTSWFVRNSTFIVLLSASSRLDVLTKTKIGVNWQE